MNNSNFFPDYKEINTKYSEEGFIAPVDIMTPEQAHELRLDFEKAENELRMSQKKKPC